MVEAVWPAARDQAEGLRRLFGPRRAHMLALADVAAQDSGVSVAMATAKTLAARGHRVVLVDEHGRASRACGCGGIELFDVLARGTALAAAIAAVTPSLRLLPARRAARELGAGEEGVQQRLDACARSLRDGSDFVLVDSAVRRGRLSMLTLASPEIILALSPSADAVTQGYALLKRAAAARGPDGFRMVVRQSRDVRQSGLLADTVGAVARQHLGMHLAYLGPLAADGSGLAEILAGNSPQADSDAGDDAAVALPMPLSARRGHLQSVV